MISAEYSPLFAFGFNNFTHDSFARPPTPPIAGGARVGLLPPVPTTPSRHATGSNMSSPRRKQHRPPQITINTQLSKSPARLGLRRRRSSLTVAQSPMSALKSPNRNAGSAFNRTVLMSPSRARHFDATMGVEEDQGPSSARLKNAVNANGFIRTRRRLLFKPASAPPTGPLPAPPTLLPSPLISPSLETPLTAPAVMTGASSTFMHNSQQFPSLSTESSSLLSRRPFGRVLADAPINTTLSFSSLHDAMGSESSKQITPSSSAMPSPGFAPESFLSPEFARKLSVTGASCSVPDSPVISSSSFEHDDVMSDN